MTNDNNQNKIVKKIFSGKQKIKFGFRNSKIKG